MKIHYISCFPPNDPAELVLSEELKRWEGQTGVEISKAVVAGGKNLWEHIKSIPQGSIDILIVGGHGDGSLTGFCVRQERVSWHDLAAALRGVLSKTCTFIFYSCNGGYPGISRVFNQNSGPDFVFGPFIRVQAGAMTYAVRQILQWKMNGGGDANSAKELVDNVNSWASKEYQSSPYDQEFLRVMWSEGHKIFRHPNEPKPDEITEPPIKVQGIE